MTETTDAPLRSGAVPRHALVLGPRAVILAELDEIRMGDVLLDTSDGPLTVEEIVRRRRSPMTEFAEYRTTIRPALPGMPMRETVERRRTVDYGDDFLRVARDIETFGPLRDHHTRVRSHNPRKVGCYTHVDGWLAECSCGWPAEQRVTGGRQSARREWLEHKAAVLTAASCDAHPGLALVTAAEQDHSLPPLPWLFARNGVAVARLDALSLGRGSEVAEAWADALGSTVEWGGLKDCATISVDVASPRGGNAVAIGGYFPLDGETTK